MGNLEYGVLREILEAVAERALAGVYVIEGGKLIYVNPKLAEIFGYTVEEMIGKDPLSLVHVDDREIVRENIEKRLRGEKESTHQFFRGIRKNGEVVYVESYGSRIEIDGRIIIVGTVIDVTERVRLERNLRESQKKYRDLFDLMPDVAIILDSKGRIVEANSAATVVSGFSKEELTRMEIFDCLVEDRETVEKTIKKIIERGGGKFETVARSKSGRELFFECNTRVVEIDGEKCVLCIGRDVTEKRKMMERLVRYQRFYRNAEDLFFILDRKGRFIDINPKFAEKLGWEIGEIVGRNSKPIIHPSDLDRLRNFFRKVVSGKSLRDEFRFVSKDGRVLWFEIVEWPVKEGDEVVEVEGIVRDITQRKNLEEELRRSEERYRVIVENSQDGIVLIDSDLRITYVNPVMERITGFRQSELVGRHVLDNVPLDDSEILLNAVMDAIHRGEVERTTHRYVRRDGEVVYLESIIAPFSSRGAVIVSRDVTETIRLAKLLEAMNRISKAIVHGRDDSIIIETLLNELLSLEYVGSVVVFELRNGGISQLLKSKFAVGNVPKNCPLASKAVKGEFICVEMCEVGEVCSKCSFRDKENVKTVIGIPMVTKGDRKGAVLLYLTTAFVAERELELIKTIGEDVAYALWSVEVNRLKEEAYKQIQKNIEGIAVAIDRIRNPLAIISGIAEVMVEDEEITKKILHEVKRIEEFLDKFEKSWAESEDIQKLLKIFGS